MLPHWTEWVCCAHLSPHGNSIWCRGAHIRCKKSIQVCSDTPHQPQIPHLVSLSDSTVFCLLREKFPLRTCSNLIVSLLSGCTTVFLLLTTGLTHSEAWDHFLPRRSIMKLMPCVVPAGVHTSKDSSWGMRIRVSCRTCLLYLLGVLPAWDRLSNCQVWFSSHPLSSSVKAQKKVGRSPA